MPVHATLLHTFTAGNCKPSVAQLPVQAQSSHSFTQPCAMDEPGAHRYSPCHVISFDRRLKRTWRAFQSLQTPALAHCTKPFAPCKHSCNSCRAKHWTGVASRGFVQMWVSVPRCVFRECFRGVGCKVCFQGGFQRCGLQGVCLQASVLLGGYSCGGFIPVLHTVFAMQRRIVASACHEVLPLARVWRQPPSFCLAPCSCMVCCANATHCLWTLAVWRSCNPL